MSPSTQAPPSPSMLDWSNLVGVLRGELHTGDLMRRIYATDASAYQEMPLAVAVPACDDDIGELIRFAHQHGIGLIPRTAGTSLAGQVVGPGMVVDVSKHFTRIVEINPAESFVRVQPGVIRNELNMALAEHGMMFGPETSTQNRAMIGGMVGNNSCGSNSVRYGSTRDHLLEVRGFLSDGSRVVFGEMTAEQFDAKCEQPDALETRLYRHVRDRLGDPNVRDEITRQFPKTTIHRRNTGYAIDLLMNATALAADSPQPFNFCKLIAGSEGTLMFVTEIKLHIDPLPPPVSGLQCAHFGSVSDALRATLLAVDEKIDACELIDDRILDCTERSIEHRQNRFFIEGTPAAILVTEVRGQTKAEVDAVFSRLGQRMRGEGLGYAWPVLYGPEGSRVWDLRKAGLGLLGNIPGDEKTVPVIEDVAVDVHDLPNYIAEITGLLEKRFDLACVHYAHAGSGEIHLRPMINLKTAEGKRLFREVAIVTAELVKKYRGSLSGEHGDGRLRGEFLRQLIGDANFNLVREFKRIWDPAGVFNPGKIIDTPRMNESLRYPDDALDREIDTVFDFSGSRGILRAAEMCNGSGDCRKSHRTGGVMCPSYMATRDEKHTTRARANTLRQVLSGTPVDAAVKGPNDKPFDSDELYQVMDLCLSCKGCKSECPSTVDIGKMKAEFLQHYQDVHGIDRRTRLIADYVRGQKLASRVPRLWNRLVGTPVIRRTMNRLVGFHPDRTLPSVARETLVDWFGRSRPRPSSDGQPKGNVFVFADEFTNYSDTSVGIAMIRLMTHLGFEVEIPDHDESGRSRMSKGLLREARSIARKNVTSLKDRVSADRPLVGAEPSAILSFRDEYPDLVGDDLRPAATELGKHCLTFEEWFAAEIRRGRIEPGAFTDMPRRIWIHGHCHQKAISDVAWTRASLCLPAAYETSVIESGCCGMAGSFGYEVEHYDVSMAIGELALFPAIRDLPDDAAIAAAGTSCRHQIYDGTGRIANHPAEILWEAIPRKANVL